MPPLFTGEVQQDWPSGGPFPERAVCLLCGDSAGTVVPDRSIGNASPFGSPGDRPVTPRKSRSDTDLAPSAAGPKRPARNLKMSFLLAGRALAHPLPRRSPGTTAIES